MRFVPGIRDIRGRESTTLFFVYISWLVLTVKFAVGGVVLPFGVMPVIGAGEFGLATGAILAIWLGREFGEKKIIGNGAGQPEPTLGDSMGANNTQKPGGIL